MVLSNTSLCTLKRRNARTCERNPIESFFSSLARRSSPRNSAAVPRSRPSCSLCSLPAHAGASEPSKQLLQYPFAGFDLLLCSMRPVRSPLCCRGHRSVLHLGLASRPRIFFSYPQLGSESARCPLRLGPISFGRTSPRTRGGEGRAPSRSRAGLSLASFRRDKLTLLVVPVLKEGLFPARIHYTGTSDGYFALQLSAESKVSPAMSFRPPKRMGPFCSALDSMHTRRVVRTRRLSSAHIWFQFWECNRIA